MIEAYCNTCNEARVLLPVGDNFSCAYCGGPARDCDCGEYCVECDNPLEIGDTWSA
jgi:hypothetical protein